MKKLQVDRGAIRFVLAGANIMCPGLTSPGGALDDEVGAETPVVRDTFQCPQLHAYQCLVYQCLALGLIGITY